MNTLPFSRYWDKISDRKVGKIWTTMRAYTPERHYFYESRMGKQFQILLRVDDVVGEVTLLKIHFRWTNGLSMEEIREDTHQDWDRMRFRELMRKFYGIDNPFLIKLFLRWTKCNNTMPSLEVYDVIEKLVQDDDDVVVLG